MSGFVMLTLLAMNMLYKDYWLSINLILLGPEIVEAWTLLEKETLRMLFYESVY